MVNHVFVNVWQDQSFICVGTHIHIYEKERQREREREGEGEAGNNILE
jgi:hypothetical protein